MVFMKSILFGLLLGECDVHTLTYFVISSVKLKPPCGKLEGTRDLVTTARENPTTFHFA